MKFRKNCIDVVMILPKTEGSIMGEKGTVMRVSMDQIMDIEFMGSVFRSMWVGLVKQDKDLSSRFEAFFRNQAIEQKRQEKLFAKAQKKAMAEELKNAEKIAQKKIDNLESEKTEALEAYDESISENKG